MHTAGSQGGQIPWAGSYFCSIDIRP